MKICFNIKRITATLLAFFVVLAGFSGCAENGRTAPAGAAVSQEADSAAFPATVSEEAPTGQPASGQPASGETSAGETPQGETPLEKISIVCTTFPQYDWVRQIVGENIDRVDLTFLINNRIDLHSFQPSVDDILRIASCDLFIYVGGESDAWVDNALKQATNPDMVIINMIDALGDSVKTEEIVEGMQEEDEEHDGEDGHDDEDGDDGGHEDEEEYDEHVWLSLKNAVVLCSVISDALSGIDPAGAQGYSASVTEYVKKLQELDARYEQTVSAAPVKTILFADRFPFRYLADDYGISYYAAFVGCSAETEASFETIVFLTEKVNELDLKNVIITESCDGAIAKTVISSTEAKNQQVLVMDSMQAVTLSDAKGETTYLSVMESNLNVLREALK